MVDSEGFTITKMTPGTILIENKNTTVRFGVEALVPPASPNYVIYADDTVVVNSDSSEKLLEPNQRKYFLTELCSLLDEKKVTYEIE